MATTEEPVRKRSRNTRTIELDLSLFPDWVGDADDNTLREVFAIGVKVKESIAINITENSQNIENILQEKLKPISSNFVNVQNDVSTSLIKMQSDLFELQKKLVNNINEVARKVPPLDSLTNKIDQVLKPVESCENKLDTLVHKYEKPAIKGALGEKEVLTILQDGFPAYTITSVAKQGGKADIEIKSTQSRQNYLVEVKDREAEVPKKEIEKFQKNVKENKVYKVGILFSLRSGISVYASQGRFAVKFEDDQYYIYVPNALNERKDLIVWIVMLADQLAVLNQGLTDRQTEVVTSLLREFQESVETSKNCKQHIKSLKETVKALEKNMDPLLKVIEDAKRKLNTALNKN
jgi:hypothetical protein